MWGGSRHSSVKTSNFIEGLEGKAFSAPRRQALSLCDRTVSQPTGSALKTHVRGHQAGRRGKARHCARAPPGSESDPSPGLLLPARGGPGLVLAAAPSVTYGPCRTAVSADASPAGETCPGEAAAVPPSASSTGGGSGGGGGRGHRRPRSAASRSRASAGPPGRPLRLRRSPAHPGPTPAPAQIRPCPAPSPPAGRM